MTIYHTLVRLRITIPPEGNWIAGQEHVQKKLKEYLLYLAECCVGMYPEVNIPERMRDGYSNPRRGWAPLDAFGGQIECGTQLE